MDHIPGTFTDPLARHIRWIRLADFCFNEVPVGWRYEARVPDGTLQTLVSQDQPDNSRPLWHLSVSHRNLDGKPDRVPTWDELKHAKYALVPADVPMVLIFPRKKLPAGGYVNLYETCLHLWEAEPGIDE